ncbi:MAG: acylneuraminate cytidylyltransferase [Bacteroidetes bacterium]|jgi:spore coat polysaccharide biosynthesis protein SpsF|nr:acylneuraminate cytidylyltransferase [Bacteroidota bacterium]
MKAVTIIQARTTSTRLPNKVLLEIYGTSLLERVINQAKKIRSTDEVWVATSTHENDDLIEILCERKNIPCHRGSLEDVRGRFYHIAKKQNADIIVRITADNPFTEPEYAAEMIDFLKENHDKYDYVRMDRSTILEGTHSEVFMMDALEKSVTDFDDSENREHVTPAIIREMRMFETKPLNKDLIAKKPYFIGVDTFSDFKKATYLYKVFGEQDTLKQLIKTINKNGNAI